MCCAAPTLAAAALAAIPAAAAAAAVTAAAAIGDRGAGKRGGVGEEGGTGWGKRGGGEWRTGGGGKGDGGGFRVRVLARRLCMVMYTLVCYVLDASRYISKCVCKLFPSSRVRHLYQKTNLTKRLVQLGGAQAGLKHREKAVPDT